MPKCAVKNCNNNSKRVKKEDGISYFHFPLCEVQKEKWRKIIAQERCEEFYKPNKSSVVCSDHFSESDMYYTGKGIRRLKRDAVLLVEHIKRETQGSPTSLQNVNISDEEEIFQTPMEAALKKRLRVVTFRQKMLLKRNKALSIQNRRLKQRIHKMQVVVKDLKDKVIISKDHFLQLNFKPQILDLVLRM